MYCKIFAMAGMNASFFQRRALFLTLRALWDFSGLDTTCHEIIKNGLSNVTLTTDRHFTALPQLGDFCLSQLYGL